MLGFGGDYTPGAYNFKIQDALAGAASVPYSKDKQLGKNFAVFIVGADLRVGPRYHVVHRGRGPTRRSAPTMDNAGLFLRERLIRLFQAPTGQAAPRNLR